MAPTKDGENQSDSPDDEPIPEDASSEPIIEEVINKVEFTWCLSDQVIAELPGSAPFWIVRREKLDQLITDEAIKIGAGNVL